MGFLLENRPEYTSGIPGPVVMLYRSHRIYLTLYIVIFIASTPLWNFAYLPGVYSAPTPYLAIPLGLLFVLLYATKRVLKISSHFALLAILSSLAVALSVFQYLMYDHSSFSAMVLGVGGWCIGVMTYLAYVFAIRWLGFERFILLFKRMAMVLLIIGVVEFVLKSLNLSLIPNSITQLLSGRESARLMLTTSEPSFAVQLLLFMVPFVFYKSAFSLPKKLAIILMALIVFIGCLSLTGLFVLVFFLCFYYVVMLGRARKLCLLILCLILATVFVVYALPPMPSDAPYYVTRVYKTISLIGSNVDGLFFALLSIDGSIQVRFGYPYLAIRMFMDYPFGIGFGQFGNAFPDYLHYIRGAGQLSDEIVGHINNANADPRNLYLRMLAEGGIVVFSVFILFVWQLIGYVKMMRERNRFLLCARLLSMALAVMMQFTTLYFAMYWLIFAIIYEGYRLNVKEGLASVGKETVVN